MPLVELFGKLDAGLFVEPFSDFAENSRQKAAVDLRRVGERNVTVFRETVGLEIAFLEAGPALEFPTLGERLLPIDPGKISARHVVFLDNMRQQTMCSRCVEDFAETEHIGAAGIQFLIINVWQKSRLQTTADSTKRDVCKCRRLRTRAIPVRH